MTEDLFSPDVLEYQNSMASTHLGHAIDLHTSAVRLRAATGGKPHDWILAHRSAISSILHSVIGLEAHIATIGRALFTDPKAPQFIPQATRSFDLAAFVARSKADQLSLLERYEYLLVSRSVAAPSSLMDQLRESISMRNILAHGHPYTTWVLLQPMEGSSSLLAIDRNDSIDWVQRFPNLKLSPPDNITSQDSRVVLNVALSAGEVVAPAFDRNLTLSWYQPVVTSRLR